MTVAEKLLEGQARALADAARAMRDDPPRPSIVGKTEEIEAVIQIALTMVQPMERMRMAYWRGFLASQIPDVDEAGRELLHLYQAVSRAFEGLLEVARAVEPFGLEVDGTLECEAALVRMRELQEEIRERWPMVDPEEVERSRALAAQGRFVTLEDLVRELDDPLR